MRAAWISACGRKRLVLASSRAPLGPPSHHRIHDGKTGDADSLFLRGNCVALGWQKMGDLASLNSRGVQGQRRRGLTGEESRGDPDRRRPDVPVRPRANERRSYRLPLEAGSAGSPRPHGGALQVRPTARGRIPASASREVAPRGAAHSLLLGRALRDRLRHELLPGHRRRSARDGRRRRPQARRCARPRARRRGRSGRRAA